MQHLTNRDKKFARVFMRVKDDLISSDDSVALPQLLAAQQHLRHCILSMLANMIRL